MEQDENEDIELEQDGGEQEDYQEDSQDDQEDSTDWKSEALKYKSMAQRYKKKAIEKREAPQKVQKEELSINRGQDTPILDEAVELRLDGYSKEEVSFILKNGGRKALEESDSYVAHAINAKREQLKAEEQASKAKDTSQMVGTTKKYTHAQLSKMTKEELEKILPHNE